MIHSLIHVRFCGLQSVEATQYMKFTCYEVYLFRITPHECICACGPWTLNPQSILSESTPGSRGVVVFQSLQYIAKKTSQATMVWLNYVFYCWQHSCDSLHVHLHDSRMVWYLEVDWECFVRALLRAYQCLNLEYRIWLLNSLKNTTQRMAYDGTID